MSVGNGVRSVNASLTGGALLLKTRHQVRNVQLLVVYLGGGAGRERHQGLSPLPLELDAAHHQWGTQIHASKPNTMVCV